MFIYLHEYMHVMFLSKQLFYSEEKEREKERERHTHVHAWSLFWTQSHVEVIACEWGKGKCWA